MKIGMFKIHTPLSILNAHQEFKGRVQDCKYENEQTQCLINQKIKPQKQQAGNVLVSAAELSSTRVGRAAAICKTRRYLSARDRCVASRKTEPLRQPNICIHFLARQSNTTQLNEDAFPPRPRELLVHLEPSLFCH